MWDEEFERIYIFCNGTGSKSQTDQKKKKLNDFSRKEFFRWIISSARERMVVGNRETATFL